MLLVQILIVIIAVFFIYRAVLSLKNEKAGFKISVFWIFLWGIIIVVAILPNTTNILSRLLGVGRGVDVAIYFSIILIFFLVYKMMVKLEKIENEITKIVSHLAIKELDKNEKDQ